MAYTQNKTVTVLYNDALAASSLSSGDRYNDKILIINNYFRNDSASSSSGSHWPEVWMPPTWSKLYLVLLLPSTEIDTGPR